MYVYIYIYIHIYGERERYDKLTNHLFVFLGNQYIDIADLYVIAETKTNTMCLQVFHFNVEIKIRNVFASSFVFHRLFNVNAGSSPVVSSHLASPRLIWRDRLSKVRSGKNGQGPRGADFYRARWGLNKS